MKIKYEVEYAHYGNNYPTNVYVYMHL